MTIWADAQLPPGIAGWISGNFGISAVAIRDIGLRDAEDQETFAAAKSAGAVMLTKDSDFCDLLTRFGSPHKCSG